MKMMDTVHNKKTVSLIISVLQSSKDMWIYARQQCPSVTMSGRNRDEGEGKKKLKKNLCLRRYMNVAVLSNVEVHSAYLLNLCSLVQYIYKRNIM